MVALEEREALQDLEQSELAEPSPRKISGDRVIYESQAFAISGAKSVGRPILCDFGQACTRDMKHEHLIQPDQYRAPEVVFGMEWDEKVDIWNAGVMVMLSYFCCSSRTNNVLQLWDMLTGKNLFSLRRKLDREQTRISYIAQMVALLGPPDEDFLARPAKHSPSIYFDLKGM